MPKQTGKILRESMGSVCQNRGKQIRECLGNLHNLFLQMVLCKAIENLSLQHDGGSAGRIPYSGRGMEKYSYPQKAIAC